MFRGQGMEFAEVRPTSPATTSAPSTGTCRPGSASPYVKTFTEERELTLMLVVDQSGSTRFGEPVSKAALAVEVAAVLALAAAFQNDRVGALLFADEVEQVIPPRKGRRHALRVIRDLVAFRARRPAHQPRGQPLLRRPAAAPSEHRRGALGLHRRGMGAAAPPARGPARGRRDHGGRSRASTSSPRRGGSRCRTPRAGGGCWWTPAAAMSATG